MVVRYIKIMVATLTLVVVGLVTNNNIYEIKAVSQGETWVIIDKPYPTGSFTTDINFTSNNVNFTQISTTFSIQSEIFRLKYENQEVYNSTLRGVWENNNHKTITFETAPTGDLLTWLENNAVKQIVYYTQDDLDNAWADGYDAGVFTVYENGFAGIYNPYTGQFYTNENSYPYYNGYDAGVFTVYENGFGGIINPNTNEYYSDKDNYLYWLGVEDSNDFSFTGLLFQVFTGIGSVLTIELLPNVTLGAIVAVPIVFGIIYFILGKRKGD